MFYLLVMLISLQGAIYAADTNFSGLKIDGDGDPATGLTTNVLTVTDTSGSNTLTVDGAGDVSYIETGGSATDADFAVAGVATFSNVVFIPVTLVGDLATVTTVGALAIVTDASSATDCSSGAGATVNLCTSAIDGTWVDVT